MRWQTPSLYAWGWLEALVKEEFRIKADTCSGKSTRFWLENYSPVYRANKALETWAWVFLMVKPKCSNSIPAAFFKMPSISICHEFYHIKKCLWDFFGGPRVRARHFYCHGTGSILGQGTKIPQATWCKKQKRKKYLWPQTSRARPAVSHFSPPTTK